MYGLVRGFLFFRPRQSSSRWSEDGRIEIFGGLVRIGGQVERIAEGLGLLEEQRIALNDLDAVRERHILVEDHSGAFVAIGLIGTTLIRSMAPPQV